MDWSRLRRFLPGMPGLEMPAAPPQQLRCAVPTRSAAELQAEEHRYADVTKGLITRVVVRLLRRCLVPTCSVAEDQAEEHRYAPMTKEVTPGDNGLTVMRRCAVPTPLASELQAGGTGACGFRRYQPRASMGSDCTPCKWKENFSGV